jgi:hypothetical protein
MNEKSQVVNQVPVEDVLSADRFGVLNHDIHQLHFGKSQEYCPLRL